MPDNNVFLVTWTEQSLNHASIIKSYLLERFTQKEVDSFYSLLQAFEDAIILFPKLYPETSKSKIRRAVLSKTLSVFYRIKRRNIEILAVLDNRCDLSEWI